MKLFRGMYVESICDRDGAALGCASLVGAVEIEIRRWIGLP
jgi:hypothetical protein